MLTTGGALTGRLYVRSVQRRQGCSSAQLAEFPAAARSASAAVLEDSGIDAACSLQFPGSNPYRLWRCRIPASRTRRSATWGVDMPCSLPIPASSRRATSKKRRRCCAPPAWPPRAFTISTPTPTRAWSRLAGRVAAAAGVDSIVALGGGSSLDCAKGINFVLTGGGTMRDYWGYGKARGTLLPSIGIPTTAGTGSEAQSYAIISDAETHVKMACGDPGIAFRVAILDPALTVSQPRAVTAIAGYDALSHAVESYVTLKRTPISDLFAREAWRLLSTHYAAGAGRAGRSAGPRRHAARVPLRRRRDRAVDARRDARLRQSADRPLRHDARRRHRRHAAARRALERRSVGDRYADSCDLQPRSDPGVAASGSPRRRRRPSGRASRARRVARPTCRPWPQMPPSSGPGRSIPAVRRSPAALELYREAY